MEQVLCVKAEKLGRHLEREGLITENTAEILKLIVENCEYVPRARAEEDAGFRQIIPYVLVRHAGKFLLLERLATQGEKRLHGKLSVGVGGHINPVDGEGAGALRAGLMRELDEELELEGDFSPRFLGVINDFSSPVSFYHLGLLYLLDAEAALQVREKSKMSGTYQAPSELRARADFMETWSKIVIESPVFGAL